MLWNFSQWMNALGMKRPDEPEIVHAVQPVVMMGDHSALVSPVLPAMAWQGGRRSAIALVFSAFQLTSLSGGGTFVRQLIFSGSAAIYRFQLTTAPGALANVQALAIYDMAPDATVSRCALGTLAADPGDNGDPLFDVLATGNTFIVDGFYLQPGATLQVVNSAPNVDLQFACQFEDLAATVPRA